METNIILHVATFQMFPKIQETPALPVSSLCLERDGSYFFVAVLGKLWTQSRRKSDTTEKRAFRESG